MNAVKVSKYLSRVLRHEPERIGITLDDAGWVDVDVLLAACAARNFPVSRAQLDTVVAENDKQRFAFSADGTRIRASQGHTVAVDLGLVELAPPEVLYHGTSPGSVAAILVEGLRPMRRHAVHLSTDVDTARRVGARRGRPVVFVVRAGRMAAAGHVFHRSDNGVWLVDAVPPRFLQTRA